MMYQSPCRTVDWIFIFKVNVFFHREIVMYVCDIRVSLIKIYVRFVFCRCTGVVSCVGGICAVGIVNHTLIMSLELTRAKLIVK